MTRAKQPEHRLATTRLQVATGASCVKAAAMKYGLREGDWVLHHSYPKPIRVIGVGLTIAVEYQTGEMRAFKPTELEKLSLDEAPSTRKVAIHERSRYPLLASDDAARWRCRNVRVRLGWMGFFRCPFFYTNVENLPFMTIHQPRRFPR